VPHEVLFPGLLAWLRLLIHKQEGRGVRAAQSATIDTQDDQTQRRVFPSFLLDTIIPTPDPSDSGVGLAIRSRAFDSRSRHESYRSGYAVWLVVVRWAPRSEGRRQGFATAAGPFICLLLYARAKSFGQRSQCRARC
jgi:hypothetical protein